MKDNAKTSTKVTKASGTTTTIIKQQQKAAHFLSLFRLTPSLQLSTTQPIDAYPAKKTLPTRTKSHKKTPTKT
jgi:hypothetical protein